MFTGEVWDREGGRPACSQTGVLKTEAGRATWLQPPGAPLSICGHETAPSGLALVSSLQQGPRLTVDGCRPVERFLLLRSKMRSC